MKIEQLGEFGLIGRIQKRLKNGASVIQGIGDDCAVIDAGAGRYTLLTADMLVAGVDFLPTASPRLVGRKALAVSLSDIAACGGIPRYCLVSLGLPKGFPVSSVDAIYAGMSALGDSYGVRIVGGDLSAAPRLIIDVSLYGDVEKKNLVLRSGARPGDVIFVTGSFGGSIRGKHLRFIPRLTEARYLVEHFKVSSMIDCSDGLAQDLGHILDASGAGCVIFEALIPQSSGSAGIKDALFSGEDFELIFTVGSEDAVRLMAVREYEFTSIGTVTWKKEGRRIINGQGAGRPLLSRGFSHF